MRHFFIRLTIYFVIFLSPHFAGVQAQSSHPTICLNMIVKDESQVITRCLTSVLPLIDSLVIVDTGSTDGTQSIIKEFMAKHGIAGELHERPWVNFAHNRNEALNLAKGKSDYLLFIDADEYFVYEPDFTLPKLNKDYYYITVSYSGTKYSRIHLIKNQPVWQWVGVVHEVLCPSATSSFATLEKVTNTITTEGARSRDPEKYHKDAQVLEEALKENPDNTRYVFYLAQSYRDSGDYSLALKNYEKRADMGGWDQEVFYALYQIGAMQEALEMPVDVIINSYKRAYQYRPARIEPLYQIARLYRLKGDYNAGYSIAKIAQTVPVSQDLLFVQQWIYDYGILLERSICAYYMGNIEECQQISLELLKRKNLPANERACIESNLGYANAKLLEQILNKQKN